MQGRPFTGGQARQPEMKILIVEDDTHINEMLSELLTLHGYETAAAYSGTEALLLLPGGGFSLILLDLMLPGKTGEQVLAEIRASSNVPVIILTARTDKETTVQLLRQGADDFIDKPFDNNELLARISLRLRNAPVNPDARLGFNGLALDDDGYDAVFHGRKAGLSKREFEILKLMMSRPAKVFTKDNLYESVWGGEFLGVDNTVNVHISKLRAKLNAVAPGQEFIQTVWGIGFKMKE
jgi:DNA-binding response OmpR family regulator